jgi:hypothetical protein
MTVNRKYGRTELAPVTTLPELAIDMSEGQPVPTNLGKTEVPVCVIQGPTLDFEPTVPALQLCLTLRPGATPAQVAVDLFRLYAAAIRLELSQGGTGLLLEEISCDEPSCHGSLQVTFKPSDLRGAAERLAGVVSAIHGVLDYPSLQRFEAKVVAVAA